MAEEKTQPVADVEKEKKELDFSNLEAQLEELSADDYTQAERECRMAADPTPDIVHSSAFCARLAARAVGVSYAEVRTLKIKVYASVIERVKLFLLSSLGEMVTQRNS